MVLLLFENLLPHFKSTLFITGAFCTAWSWDLVYYGISHTLVDENPLRDQISFGHQTSPNHILGLLFQYLLWCGLAAVFSDYLLSFKHEEPLLSTLPPPSPPHQTSSSSTTTTTNRHYFDHHNNMIQAAVTAIEFFPSPVFAGKLMAYIGEHFTNLSLFQSAIINLGATWFAASIAHTMPLLFEKSSSKSTSTSPPPPSTDSDQNTSPPSPSPPPYHHDHSFLERFSQVVQNTLGFGLGIAWNVLTLQQLGPQEEDDDGGSSNDSNGFNLIHTIAFAGYLVMLTLISFRLAAIVPDKPITLYERQLDLLSFASYVACAFTLVGFLNYLLPDGIVGSIESLVILFAISGGVSAVVSQVDLSTTTTDDHDETIITTEAVIMNEKDKDSSSNYQYNVPNPPTDLFPPHQEVANSNNNDDDMKINHRGRRDGDRSWTNIPNNCWGCCIRIVVFIPCVWCCCPWIPIVLLLAGTSSSLHVKEHWFKLIAMVSGLSCSIEASGMLTTAMDTLAGGLGICSDGETCHHPWIFVFMQIIFAILVTAVLIPEIAPLVDESNSTDIPNIDSGDRNTNNNNNNNRGEQQLLLAEGSIQHAIIV